MKYHYLHTLPAALGLLLLTSAGSARADEAQNSAGSNITVSADYYNCDADDIGMDMGGGTVEYVHGLGSAGALKFAFTGLSGSVDADYQSGSGNSYMSKQNDVLELRLSTLYSSSSLPWLAYGIEYIHTRDDYSWTNYGIYKHYVDRGTKTRPDPQWDGTTYTKVSSSGSGSNDTNSLYLKCSLSSPAWALYSGTHSALTLSLGLDTEVGYLFGRDGEDGSAGYIGAGKSKIAYELGNNALFLEGGYRYQRAFESGSQAFKGIFARMGYAYRW
ncbi:MAG: hypothetical protein KBG39_10350 [Opitutaceae bacterium]|jgi:hypothetical protein|nr:hypothetical protein [Opitutaceae bacterium]